MTVAKSSSNGPDTARQTVRRSHDGGRTVRHYGPSDSMDDGCGQGKQTLHGCSAIRVMVATCAYRKSDPGWHRRSNAVALPG